jgi:prepilin signal peptidase PulO-like enzyme (type II secretory pathway)
VNTVLAIPYGVRLLFLAGLGFLAAGGINLAVYRLAWNKRSISPWSGPIDPRLRRSRADRIPLVGWWRLRREARWHGRAFWVRPLAVELFVAAMFVGLYAWEVGARGLYQDVRNLAPVAESFATADFALTLHAQYLSHVVLACLMLVASLIDLDEQTIPDSITIPGTLLGLGLATLWPWSLLPAAMWMSDGHPMLEFLTFVSPHPWSVTQAIDPAQLAALGFTCWTLWCVGLLPRKLAASRGWGIAWRVFWRRIARTRFTYETAALWTLGLILIWAVLHWGDPARQAALLTALVGIAIAGIIVWIVRVIGRSTLGREAMGFGDVTLLAMVGAFIGWQGSLVVFFLGACLALVMGIFRWVLHRYNELPFGPYLCLATTIVVVRWPSVWNGLYEWFDLGWILLAVLGVCLLLMGVMLWVYAQVRRAWFGL